MQSLLSDNGSPRRQYPSDARVVAIAASAGGLAAVSSVLGGLPANFPAAILLVQHLDPKRPSQLAEILTRRCELRVKQAQDRDQLMPGLVFIAPPGAHLVLSTRTELSLSYLPPLHFVRPSADQLFESMAKRLGFRAIVVVLTGTGLDGASGAQSVRRSGGRVIVQDQATSEFFGMPGAAIAAGEVDGVLPLEKIAERLIALTGTQALP